MLGSQNANVNTKITLRVSQRTKRGSGEWSSFRSSVLYTEKQQLRCLLDVKNEFLIALCDFLFLFNLLLLCQTESPWIFRSNSGGYGWSLQLFLPVWWSASSSSSSAGAYQDKVGWISAHTQISESYWHHLHVETKVFLLWHTSSFPLIKEMLLIQPGDPKKKQSGKTLLSECLLHFFVQPVISTSAGSVLTEWQAVWIKKM